MLILVGLSGSHELLGLNWTSQVRDKDEESFWILWVAKGNKTSRPWIASALLCVLSK